MPWPSGYLEVNGIRLHYTRTGGALPPVVLAHGFSDDGLCWTPVARALESQYDVIMLDARGHGLSDAPDSGYTLLDLAADLAGAIRALGLDRPAVLGHSMGGGTALALAAAYPDVPGAIISEDAGIITPRPERDEAWFARRAEQLVSFATLTREELIARCRAQSPTWPEDEYGPWADAKMRLSPRTAQMRLEAPEAEWVALLRKITCPVLLLAADTAHGGMLSAEVVAAMQAAIPQLRVERILGAGHSIRREQFSTYIALVRAFLAEWRAGRG